MTVPTASSSVCLRIRFPTGRYHATPWGQHVNEGTIEWPPSPWRLLRALLAAWHHKERHEVSEETMTQLIESLAQTLPEYQLPPATSGHTRHYMPYIEGKKENTTKVFDTFTHIGDEESLLVRWPADLSEQLRSALGLLVEQMNYLGRAESLVEIGLSNGDFHANSMPIDDEWKGDTSIEIVRLLAPYAADQYRVWRDGFNEAVSDKRKKGRGKSKSSNQPPTTLWKALQADTNDWKNAGWTRPPGSQWVHYSRPRNPFSPQPVSRSFPQTGIAPTVARFTLSGTLLPSIREALSVAERFHQSLVKWSNNDPVFSGRNDSGQPLTGHRHAHVFCEPEASGRFIGEVSVYAPDGFSGDARRALEKMRGIWGRGGHDVKVVLTFLGTMEEAWPVSELFGQSTEWTSLTPFIPTRHPKTFRDGRPKLDESGLQIGSPEHDLRRLLKGYGFPEPDSIEEVLRYQVAGCHLHWLQFLQNRKTGNGRKAKNQFGIGYRIRFAQPVNGPIALGYGAHFSLGLFSPYHWKGEYWRGVS